MAAHIGISKIVTSAALSIICFLKSAYIPLSNCLTLSPKELRINKRIRNTNRTLSREDSTWALLDENWPDVLHSKTGLSMDTREVGVWQQPQGEVFH